MDIDSLVKLHALFRNNSGMDILNKVIPNHNFTETYKVETRKTIDSISDYFVTFYENLNKSEKAILGLICKYAFVDYDPYDQIEIIMPSESERSD